MAILVIDPQGEFAKDIRGQSTGEFQLPLGDILEPRQTNNGLNNKKPCS